MKSILVLCIAALCLSGCFGYPAGSAQRGDTVAVKFTVKDAATGDVIDEQAPAAFVLGRGSSPLGSADEQALVGHMRNETVRFASTSYARRTIDAAESPPQPLTTVLTAGQRSGLQAKYGNLSAGQSIDVGGFNITIVDLSPDVAHFRYDFTDGMVLETGVTGIQDVIHVQGDAFTTRLQGVAGATFAIRPDIFGQTPLDLEQGHYKVLDTSGNAIHLAFNPLEDNFDVHYTIEATILSIEHGGPAQPVDGNYGVRDPSAFQPTVTPTTSG